VGDIYDDPLSLNSNVDVELRINSKDNQAKIIITFDLLTFEKIKQVAYARGFTPEGLIKSYILEWLEYDQSYLGD